MIHTRNTQELLDLVKDIPSELQWENGEYREPERCPYCRELLTPSIVRGRILSVCLRCEEED